MGVYKPALLVTYFLVSGFFYTFAYKLQGSQVVNEGKDMSVTKTFFHPYMQTLTLFVGELLCFVVYYFHPTAHRAPPNFNTRMFMVPAISDVICSTLQCIALALIPGSTYMMLKGASIISTLFFSHWLIDFEIRSRHIAGCGLAVMGLCIAGFAEIWLGSATGDQDNGNQKLGYALMIVSLVFNGFFYAYEQKILKKYDVNPLYMVGWEGFYGSIFSLFIVIVVSFIPCPFSGNKCVYSYHGEAFIEIPSTYLYQIFTNFQLFVLVAAGMVLVPLYTFYGVTITQDMDSLTRSLLNICRTALIWFFGILVSLTASDPAYWIESLSFWVNAVKLIGFSCIVAGTMIYNQIICKQVMDRLDGKYLNNRCLRPRHMLEESLNEMETEMKEISK